MLKDLLLLSGAAGDEAFFSRWMGMGVVATPRSGDGDLALDVALARRRPLLVAEVAEDFFTSLLKRKLKMEDYR